ncbi:hypothetical protein [Helicobacter fennelliae]|uniref:Uncharacterized protein n=1 Tax=Helicobacter fennelliae MRY12-0050 TaxID=1325130 RepID=T1DWL8_9HELI|nr:hypothetical protein [Helicobacter fennelliae]GAD19748.1 hypothetical protein HFN_0988 [Helicobacter fennelliae MRY12-0050]STP07215.1 Uncharacterised protein [Helicobacter fennelliae]
MKNPRKYLVFVGDRTKDNQNAINNKSERLDFELQKVKPKNSHITIASIGFSSLITTKIEHFSSPYAQDMTNALYHHCIQNGVFSPDEQYILTYAELAPKHYQVFGMRLCDAKAQMLIPHIFLPLALKNPHGIFMIENWLCLYQDKQLVYDYYCNDLHDLSSCLTFLRTMYDIQGDILMYKGGWITQAQSLQEPQDPQDLQEPRAQEALLDVQYKEIQESIERLSLDFGALALEQKVKLTPLYNDSHKSIYHTKSFWNLIKIVGCCATIALFPLAKALYAHHIHTQAQEMALFNQQLQSTLATKKSTLSQLPQKIATIDQNITTLQNIHTKYIPRLKILSYISSVASRNFAWITRFDLKGDLERGDVVVEMGVHSQKQDHLSKLVYEFERANEVQVLDFESISEDACNAKLVLRFFNA